MHQISFFKHMKRPIHSKNQFFVVVVSFVVVLLLLCLAKLVECIFSLLRGVTCVADLP